MKRNKLTEELILLSKLECQVQEQYDDQEIIDSINSFKQNGLSFFLENKIYERALYEVRELNNNLVHLVTGV
jgi:hypothetical protein|tara:strand:- start:715 stop:930 length:216 start_codon:yes stop_codon:yes gene_type:complete